MSVTIANPTPACARSSATARTAAACAAILALLQTAGDAQLGGAPPPIRQERKLVAEFDKNGNQRLDSVERKAAREWLRVHQNGDGSFGRQSNRSNAMDTALALQIQDAGTLVLAGLDRAREVVVRRAEEHRTTAMTGRTHGVHAEPITFGAKLAGWAFELARDRDRVVRALEGMRVGKLAGAVGVYGGGDPEMERLTCSRLGLVPEPVATQVIPRDRHSELLSVLALCATSLERFATEIRHLARTEVREVQEPFAKGQKGSSAMPHKRNPIVAERICGLARVVRADAAVGLENVALWHERDISHSSAERVVIPDAFLALDYMLDRFAWLVEGLVVDAARMRANLDSSRGLVFSQRVLLALVEAGLARDEAYRLVQRNALRAWDEELDFRTLVEADPDIAARLDREALAGAFDLRAALRSVDVLFERLAALSAPKEDPVHA